MQQQQQQPHPHHDLIYNIITNDTNANANDIIHYGDDIVIYNHVDNYDYDEILDNLKIENIEPIKIKIKCEKKRVCKRKEHPVVQIPAFADHDAFKQCDHHKVQELKEICKHHGIKCGGTKQEIKGRIHSHLIQSHFITRIQHVVRRSFCKMHARISGPAYHDRAICVNDTDFYSMEHVRDIPRNQFISFKDESGVVYGFDIMSLNTYYETEMKNGQPNPSNPYNRMPFPHTLRSQMHRKICLTRILGVNCTIEAEPEPVLSPQQQDEQLLFLAFQQINSHGHYADSAWFSELTAVAVMRFMRELADIWNYRAQIMPQLKQEICPPNGDPFRHIDLRYMPHDAINHEGVQLINAFVTSGNTRDSRGLGAYYVLSALTLVSQSAQAAMPWLYESVVHFT